MKQKERERQHEIEKIKLEHEKQKEMNEHEARVLEKRNEGKRLDIQMMKLQLANKGRFPQKMYNDVKCCSYLPL